MPAWPAGLAQTCTLGGAAVSRQPRDPSRPWACSQPREPGQGPRQRAGLSS